LESEQDRFDGFVHLVVGDKKILVGVEAKVAVLGDDVELSAWAGTILQARRGMIIGMKVPLRINTADFLALGLVRSIDSFRLTTEDFNEQVAVAVRHLQVANVGTVLRVPRLAKVSILKIDKNAQTSKISDSTRMVFEMDV
jgi:hypothetical protein